MAKAATEAALAAGYVGAGTVEFIADPLAIARPQTAATSTSSR